MTINWEYKDGYCPHCKSMVQAVYNKLNKKYLCGLCNKIFMDKGLLHRCQKKYRIFYNEYRKYWIIEENKFHGITEIIYCPFCGVKL